jgi:hypothetical protein
MGPFISEIPPFQVHLYRNLLPCAHLSAGYCPAPGTGFLGAGPPPLLARMAEESRDQRVHIFQPDYVGSLPTALKGCRLEGLYWDWTNCFCGRVFSRNQQKELKTLTSATFLSLAKCVMTRA